MTTPIQETKPAQASAPAQSNGPIKDQDVKYWSDRGHDILARPSEHLHSRSPSGAQSWFARLFGCFTPIDTCLITCCCPCVTFGKAHHRMQISGELEGYETINTSCLLLCASGCIGCACIPVAMQRQAIREKYNLEGNCIEDLVRTICCGCCTLIQNDKEAEHREGLLRQGSVGVQYQAPPGMNYPPQ